MMNLPKNGNLFLGKLFGMPDIPDNFFGKQQIMGPSLRIKKNENVPLKDAQSWSLLLLLACKTVRFLSLRPIFQ